MTSVLRDILRLLLNSAKGFWKNYVQIIDGTLLERRLENFQPFPLLEGDVWRLGNHCEIASVRLDDESAVDLAKANYLNMLHDEVVQKSAEDCIRHYAVGTCGPRGFYGTIDMHLKLEKSLANFLRVEACLVYSYGFSTVSSSIATFCKKGDVVFCDEKVNFAITQGIQASGSEVVYFPQNDDEALKKVVAGFQGNRRKFLILEGISHKTGVICSLRNFIPIAKKFKMYLFIDESISLGVLGSGGRGVTEHFNIDVSDVDMIMGTLEGAFGSVGGFSAGSTEIIDSQWLSSHAFCYSASTPSFLCQVVLTAMDRMSEKLAPLQRVANEFQQHLQNYYKVMSDADSPIKVFRTRRKNKENDVYQYCKDNNVHVILDGDNLVVHLNVELYYKKNRYQKVLDVLERAANVCS